jgi:hypothetical protein
MCRLEYRIVESLEHWIQGMLEASLSIQRTGYSSLCQTFNSLLLELYPHSLPCKILFVCVDDLYVYGLV